MQTSSNQQVRAVLTNPRRAQALARHMWQHFKQDRLLDEAASLSYTSLLSLVPLLAVVFGIASAFPVFEQWTDNFKDIIYNNMVPDSSLQLEQTLEGFIGSADRLTITGTFALVITALLLMMRIERAFNLVWRVPASRSMVNKVTMYWAVLTLGPLALGAATALSAQPLIDFISGDVFDASVLRTLGVFGLTWLAFGLMFWLVPNCRVPVSFAMLGSFLTTLLFTLAKNGFVAFVSNANYSVIYGALASVPIFLLWLFVVWSTILLGASLAASLTTYNERGSDWSWPRAWEFLLVFRLLGHLYQCQAEGRSISTPELLELEPGVSPTRLAQLLEGLAKAQLVTREQDGDEGWLLKRDLNRYTLRDLYRAGDYHLPIGKEPPVPSAGAWDNAFLQLLNRKELNMDIPLAELYVDEQAPREAAL
jgi:membrane protein